MTEIEPFSRITTETTTTADNMDTHYRLNSGGNFTLSGTNCSQQQQQQQQKQQQQKQQKPSSMYTMCGSGAQVLMNNPTIMTSTKVQFMPRNTHQPREYHSWSSAGSMTSSPFDSSNLSMTVSKSDESLSQSYGYPILTAIKDFLSNLIKPIMSPGVDATGHSNMTPHNVNVMNATTTRFAMMSHDINSENVNTIRSKIYMNFMPDMANLSYSFFHSTDGEDVAHAMHDQNSTGKSKGTLAEPLNESPPSTVSGSTEMQSPSKETEMVTKSTLNDDEIAHTKDKKLVTHDTTMPPIKSHAKHETRRKCDRQKRNKNKRKSNRNNCWGKNRNEKTRHELEVRIHDDFEEMENVYGDYDDDIESQSPLKSAPSTVNTPPATPIVSTLAPAPEPVESTIVESRPGCIFSSFIRWRCGGAADKLKPKPLLPSSCHGKPTLRSQPTEHHLPVPRTRLLSDDSEENFIVIPDDSPKTTPSIEFFSTSNYFARRDVPRQRQVSECSDDFIICFEHDENDSHAGSTLHNDDIEYDISDSDTDSDEDSETDSDEEHEDNDDDSEDDEDEVQAVDDVDGACSSESENDDYSSVETNQPDSGFEEKKVTFNLCPRVHEIRAWKYAYRAARKGLWEQMALDHKRFENKINQLGLIIAPVLEALHRDRVFKERFEQPAHQQTQQAPPQAPSTPQATNDNEQLPHPCEGKSPIFPLVSATSVTTSPSAHLPNDITPKKPTSTSDDIARVNSKQQRLAIAE